MHDVIVVGGGPSGLSAASKLAEAGLDVLVLERKKAIGEHVVCTGIVGEEAFREFCLSRDSIQKSIRRIQWISPCGSYVDYEHPDVFAHIVDREKFDINLSHNVSKNGAIIELNCDVIDITINKDSAIVSTKNQKKELKHYNSRVIIIATGINYNLNRKLGLGYPKDFLNGVQAEISLENIDCTQVFIGQDIALGAFAWAIPLEEKTVRIGLMTEADPKESFERLMKKLGVDEEDKLDKMRVQHKVIAQGLVSKTFGDRVLVLGEAAGQVKTTTGGGIYFGLFCAEIASQVVKEKCKEGKFTKSDMAEYEKQWKKAIQKEILLGYYTRKICKKFNDMQIEELFKKARTDGVLPILREKGNFDWHSGLILSMMKRIPFWEILKAKASDFISF